MNAKLREMVSACDSEERFAAVQAMCAAIEEGNIPQADALLEQSPLLDHFVPYNANCWSQLAAATGRWKMVNFWREREKTTRTTKEQVTLESLLFWAMGDRYLKPKGDSVEVAERLLNAGADVEGDINDCSPLHRAVFMNRPALVKLLIQKKADLARRYVTGESVLQIARRNQISQECAKLLEQAGAPLELPKKLERPKPVRTIDLRESAKKLSDGIEKAIRNFARQHRNEAVTAIALASIPHEAYVMVSFDTGEFTGNPWDASYHEFAWIKFPDWARAFKGDQMHLIDLDGRTRLKNYDEDEPLFKKMIVATLQSLQSQGAFTAIKIARGCRIGIQMTQSGKDKFSRLSKGAAGSKNDHD